MDGKYALTEDDMMTLSLCKFANKTLPEKKVKNDGQFIGSLRIFMTCGCLLISSEFARLLRIAKRSQSLAFSAFQLAISKIGNIDFTKTKRVLLQRVWKQPAGYCPTSGDHTSYIYSSGA